MSSSACQFTLGSLHGFPLVPLPGCDFEGPCSHDRIVKILPALNTCQNSNHHSFIAIAQRYSLVSSSPRRKVNARGAHRD